MCCHVRYDHTSIRIIHENADRITVSAKLGTKACV
jgi:hypothetical protein